MKRVLAAATAALIAFPVVGVSAQDVSGVAAAFSNPAPTGSLGGTADDTRVCWGSSAPAVCASPGTDLGTSAYGFQRNTGTVNFVSGGLINLGSFTHYNDPILSPFLESVDLDVDFNVSGLGPVTMQWTVQHGESTNNATPCEFGGANPCRDRVDFTLFGSTGAGLFTVGSVDYDLEILGWGDAVTQAQNPDFFTAEGAQTSINLYARITELPGAVVPEPASLALLSLGFVGMAAAARRRKA